VLVAWVVGVLVVVGVIVATVAWLNTQYYVGVDDGEVTIFRGVPQTLGPIDLSSPIEHSGTNVDDLRSAYLRERVIQTIQADSLDDARAQVDMLQDDTSS
jgi:protein phosphatase